MGTYDEVKYKCVYCNKENTSQTKALGSDRLKTFKVGNLVNKNDCIMKLKEPCMFCGKYSAVVIKDKIIIEIVGEEKADCAEIQYGQIKKELK